MSPEQCAKSGSEDAEQTALFCWARNEMNEGRLLELEWLHAIPNGGSRGSTKDHAMAVGARLKATGVKAGVSDLFLPSARHKMHGLYIEMKKSKEFGGGTVSDKQQEFGEAMQARGYGFCVCYGWIEAANVLRLYLEG